MFLSQMMSEKRATHLLSSYAKMFEEEVFRMSSNEDEAFREQLRKLVSEFEKKGVSLEMILDYVNSMKSQN